MKEQRSVKITTYSAWPYVVGEPDTWYTLRGQKGASVDTSIDAEIAALLTARRVLNTKLWNLNHTNRPKSQKKLVQATTPLLAQLSDNTVALRAAIVGRVWREHPDWRRARVADQRQVTDLAESVYTEIVSNADVQPVESNDGVAAAPWPKSLFSRAAQNR